MFVNEMKWSVKFVDCRNIFDLALPLYNFNMPKATLNNKGGLAVKLKPALHVEFEYHLPGDARMHEQRHVMGIFFYLTVSLSDSEPEQALPNTLLVPRRSESILRKIITTPKEITIYWLQ